LVGSPQSWSGVPGGLARGLLEHGCTSFAVSAEPPEALQRLVRKWLAVTGRNDSSWAQRSEAVWTRAAVARRRVRRTDPGGSARWVQMGSEFGHPLGAGFVTFEDMTVALAHRLPHYLDGELHPAVARRWIRRQAAIYRRARACCAASGWAAASIVNDYGVDPAKVHVVGFGLNVEIEPPAHRDWRNPRFLFVGNDWDRKNGEQVLRAFSLLRQQVPAAELDVVSDHPPISQPGVRAHGRIAKGTSAFAEPEARARLEELFRQATCFVLPSKYEPFGMAYAEAGFAGLPSIATSVGGARDAVGRTGGVFVDPLDFDQLVAAMREMCDPEQARRYSAAARAHAEQLRWKEVAGRVGRVLGVVAEAAAPPDLIEPAEWLAG
jgi:hypothetical protein